MKAKPLVLTLLPCAVIAISSCDGDSASALDDALGYLPADAPLALAISTDLDSEPFRDVDAALQRFGVEGGLEGQLEELAGYEGEISFARDVEPLLGNELVVGVPSFSGGLDEYEFFPPFVATVRVSDADALGELLEDIGLEEREEIEGATTYGEAPPEVPEGLPPAEDVEPPEPAPATVAVDDDVLVVAESAPVLEEALQQRGGDDRLTEELFGERLGELPDEGIVRIAGAAPTVLEALGIEQAVSIPWVDALRSYGLVAQVEGRTLSLDAAISGDEVPRPDLPLDPGPGSPRVIENRPTVATRDQAQTIEFGIAAIRTLVPQAAFEEVVGRLERQLGDSLASLVDQFGEGIVAELGDGETVTRSVLRAPAVAARALEALRHEVPRLAQLTSAGGPAEQALDVVRYAIPALPLPEEQYFPKGSKVETVTDEPDLYRLLPPPPERRGDAVVRLAPPGTQFVFGVIDGVLVTAPSIEAARETAAERPVQVDLPPGALAIQIPVEAADLDLPGAPNVTVTTIEAGIEATPTGLRLHAEASL